MLVGIILSGNLVFFNQFDVLLKKRLSGVAELRYTMLYAKSQLNVKGILK